MFINSLCLGGCVWDGVGVAGRDDVSRIHKIFFVGVGRVGGCVGNPQAKQFVGGESPCRKDSILMCLDD